MKRYVSIFLLMSVLLVGCGKVDETKQSEKLKESDKISTQKKQFVGKYIHESTGEFNKKPDLSDKKGMSKDVRKLTVPERYPDEIIIDEGGKAEFLYYQKDEGVEAKFASNIKIFTLAYKKENDEITFQFPKVEDETFNYIIKADKRNERYVKFLDNNAKKIEIDGYYNTYDATKVVDNNDLKQGLLNSIGSSKDILKNDELISIRKKGNLFIKDVYKRTMTESEEQYDFDGEIEDKRMKEVAKKADIYFYKSIKAKTSKKTKDKVSIPFNFRENDKEKGKYEISLNKNGDYQVSLYAGDIQIWKKILSSGALEIMNEEYFNYKENPSYQDYIDKFVGVWSINMNNYDKNGSLFELNGTGFKLQGLRDGHTDPLVDENVSYTPIKGINQLIVSGQRDRGIVSGGTDVGNEKVRYTYTLELVDTDGKKGLKIFDNESGTEIEEEEGAIYRIEKQETPSDFTNYVGSWQSDSASSICTISDDYITSEVSRGGRSTLGKIISKEEVDNSMIIEVEDLPYAQGVIEKMPEEVEKKEYYEDWSFKAKLVLSDENKKMKIQIISKKKSDLENASMGIEGNNYNKMEKPTSEMNFLKENYDRRNVK